MHRCRRPALRCRLPTQRCRRPTPRYRLPVRRCRLPAQRCRLSAQRCRLPVRRRRLRGIRERLHLPHPGQIAKRYNVSQNSLPGRQSLRPIEGHWRIPVAGSIADSYRATQPAAPVCNESGFALGIVVGDFVGFVGRRRTGPPSSPRRLDVPRFPSRCRNGRRPGTLTPTV